jgi:integrase
LAGLIKNLYPSLALVVSIPKDLIIPPDLPPVPPGRLRYFQPTELWLVLDECPEWLRPIAGLAVYTAMRRGEILSIRYVDVDFLNSRIVLPQTKNAELKVVHLNKGAKAVLLPLPEGKPLDRLFPNIKPAHVTVAFKRACNRAGIVDFRFHDPRHTAGSWLSMSGKDINTISKILGHKDVRMSVRYSHLSTQYLGEAVNCLDDVFEDSRPHSVPAPVALLDVVAVSD